MHVNLLTEIDVEVRMLLVVQAFNFKLQSVRLIALRVDSSTKSELFAFGSKIVVHFESIDKVFDLPCLNRLVCEVQSCISAAHIVLN